MKTKSIINLRNEFPPKIISIAYFFELFLIVILFSIAIFFFGLKPSISTIIQSKHNQVFLPFFASCISIVFGFNTRNVSLSDRARNKAAELLKGLEEGIEVDRINCLFEQMQVFRHRFRLNQIALALVWTSLFLGLISFILALIGIQVHNILTIFILVFLAYGFLVTLIDIFLGSLTLNSELNYARKKYKKSQIKIIIIMGVSGSGKTTIGEKFSNSMGFEFHDADSFHSLDAKQKMSTGIPLTDLDRQPWLMKIQSEIDKWLCEKRTVVLACSALKAEYRELLRCNDPRVKLVYLKGSSELLKERLSKRENHFLKADLLQSQLDTLEEPSAKESLIIDISDEICESIDTLKKVFSDQ